MLTRQHGLSVYRPGDHSRANSIYRTYHLLSEAFQDFHHDQRCAPKTASNEKIWTPVNPGTLNFIIFSTRWLRWLRYWAILQSHWAPKTYLTFYQPLPRRCQTFSRGSGTSYGQHPPTLYAINAAQVIFFDAREMAHPTPSDEKICIVGSRFDVTTANNLIAFLKCLILPYLWHHANF